MSPWSVLGLEAGAETRDIKRQYARLLKSARPDDDPEGFQRLRHAYEAALQISALEAAETASEAVPHLEQLTPESPWQPAAEPESVSVRAVALAREATVQNLAEFHASAVAQGFQILFERHLLERLLAAPQDIELLEATIDSLRWLTPWQTVRLSAEHEDGLIDALLTAQAERLSHLLSGGQHDAFASQLQRLLQRPWLESLERRAKLERWLIWLLGTHDGWPAETFDQLCVLFQWDPKTDLGREPQVFWQPMVARWKQQCYLESLQRLLADSDGSAEAVAAQLLLSPGNRLRQLRRARAAPAGLWTACMELRENLHRRFPEMLHQFPDADLDGWTQLTLKARHVWLWTWIGLLLFSLIYKLPSTALEHPLDGSDLFYTNVAFPVVIIVICKVFSRFWNPLSDVLWSLDQKLSEWLIPPRLHFPGFEVLPLRHGIPALLLGWCISPGPWGAACYMSLLLMWCALAPCRHPSPYQAAAQRVSKLFMRLRPGLQVVKVVLIFGLVSVLLSPALRADIASSFTAHQAVPEPDMRTETLIRQCNSEATQIEMQRWCWANHSVQECARESKSERLERCLKMKTGQVMAY